MEDDDFPENDVVSFIRQLKKEEGKEQDFVSRFARARLGVFFNSLITPEQRRQYHPAGLAPIYGVAPFLKDILHPQDASNSEYEPSRHDENAEKDEKIALSFADITSGNETDQTRSNYPQQQREIPIGSIYFATQNNKLGNYSSTMTQLPRYFNADAITIGRNTLFQEGKADLTTTSGQALYIHEMVHAMQSKRDPFLEKDEIPLSSISSLEEEANKVEKTFLSHMKLGGELATRFTKERLGSESFVVSSVASALDLLGKYQPAIGATTNNFELYGATQGKESVTTNYSLASYGNNNSPASRSISLNLRPVNYDTFPYLSYRAVEAKTDSRAQNETTGRSQTPLFAVASRANDAPAAISSATASSAPKQISPTAAPSADIEQLSDKIYDMILRRIRMERDRRGIK